jgi:hypothetical protein
MAGGHIDEVLPPLRFDVLEGGRHLLDPHLVEHHLPSIQTNRNAEIGADVEKADQQRESR